MPTKLATHEWISVASILLLVMLVIFIAFWDNEPPIPDFTNETQTKQSISVSIQGAVSQPGEYDLPSNSKIADLLELAQPFPNANLKGINPQARLRNGRHLTIKEISTKPPKRSKS
ncbi:MAG: hypothetical protein Q8K75_05970 [Chlamydiales bacterium]|nr:hypothetical protein [Chlamydiales bacterium]